MCFQITTARKCLDVKNVVKFSGYAEIIQLCLTNILYSILISVNSETRQ